MPKMAHFLGIRKYIGPGCLGITRVVYLEARGKAFTNLYLFYTCYIISILVASCRMIDGWWSGSWVGDERRVVVPQPERIL